MVKGKTHLQVFDDSAQLSVPEGPFTELCLFTPEQGVFQDPTNKPRLKLGELMRQEPCITGTSLCPKSHSRCADRNYRPWETLECSASPLAST